MCRVWCFLGCVMCVVLLFVLLLLFLLFSPDSLIIYSCLFLSGRHDRRQEGYRPAAEDADAAGQPPGLPCGHESGQLQVCRHSCPHQVLPRDTSPHHTIPHYHTTPYHITPHHTTQHHTTPHQTTSHFVVTFLDKPSARNANRKFN